MKLILEDRDCYILRFDQGEDVIAGLLDFAKHESVDAAHFTALGAAEAVTLSFYNLPEKRYEDHDINEALEIVSVTGNIGVLDGAPAVHAHGSFGKRDLSIVGGHVKKLVVSATCEVHLQIPRKGNIRRACDKTTGLNLMQ